MFTLNLEMYVLSLRIYEYSILIYNLSKKDKDILTQVYREIHDIFLSSLLVTQNKSDKNYSCCEGILFVWINQSELCYWLVTSIFGLFVFLFV